MPNIPPCLVVALEPPLHCHSGGEGPQIRPGLAAGRQGLGQLHGVGREVGGGEDLLEDVRSQLQACVVSPDGVRVVTALIILKRQSFMKRSEDTHTHVACAVVPVLKSHTVVVQTAIASSSTIGPLQTLMET